MVTLNWSIFKQTYLRPLINDVLEESFTDEVLEKSTYMTVTDMLAKGVPSIGPSPSSTTTAAKSQINFLTVANSVRQGNVFYVSINSESESYIALASDGVEEICAGLTAVINNSTKTEFANITATDQTFRVQVEGAPGVPFLIQGATAQGSDNAVNNPALELSLSRESTSSFETIDSISQVTSDYQEAFNVLAYGIRYFLVSDPIVRLSTSSGLQITREDSLIMSAKQEYYNAILAHLEANNITNALADFWKAKLVSVVDDTSVSGGLTFDQQLALQNNEYDRKIEQDDNSIIDTGSQTRLNQNNSTRNQKSLLQLQRQWQLEREFKSLNNRQATNGYWTPAGQITVSFLSDYDVNYQDTITVDLLQAPNSYFGLDYVVNASQTLIGNPLDISKYKKLEFNLTADNNITYRFYSSNNGIDFTQVGADVTDRQITKEYYLPPSKYIRIDIVGSTNDTNFYIEGNLRA